MRLSFFIFCCVTFSSAANITVSSVFGSNETFALGEFSATLEACRGGDSLAAKNKLLQIRCLRTLLSTAVACVEVSVGNVGPLSCNLEGFSFTSDIVLFECEAACPLQNETTAAALATANEGKCSARSVDGQDNECYASGYCQMISQQAAFGGSFGNYCPNENGEYCCSETTSIMSKMFLQSVDALQSDCSPGYERIVLSLSLMVFDVEYEIFSEAVHNISRPDNIFEFEGTAKSFAFKNINSSTVSEFLLSRPTEEGAYKSSQINTASGFRELYYQKIILLTKCYDTGYDATMKKRATPSVFSESGVATREGKIFMDLEILLKRKNTAHDLKNRLDIQIIATADTFILESSATIRQDKQAPRTVHAVYNSYEAAKTDTSEDFSRAISSRDIFEGDQLCSKHSIEGDQAKGTLLKPNAIGACALTEKGERFADAAGTKMFGKQIAYKTTTMGKTAEYFFGCDSNWLDVSDIFPSPDGVYFFQGALKNTAKNTHETSFWMVKGESLNRERLGNTEETLADRFAAGLFYYDAESGKHLSDVSDRLQIDSITAQLPRHQLPAGCVEEKGFLKAACNTVCFDAEMGLLTPSRRENATVLVHHVSVALLASDEEMKKEHAFTRRRKVLQSEDKETKERISAFVFKTRSKDDDRRRRDHPRREYRAHGDGAFFLAYVLLLFFLFFVCCSCTLRCSPQKYKKCSRVHYASVE